MKSVVEQRFFHEFIFDNKAFKNLKYLSNFVSVENVQISTVVKLNSNFITSLVNYS